MVILPHRRLAFQPQSAAGPSTLLTGLWAWYNLDEASGNAIDSSGNSRDMTAAASAASESGTAPDGGNCRLRSTTPNIFMERTGVNLFPSSVTIAFWHYLPALSGVGNFHLSGDASELNLAIMPRSTTASRIYTNNGLTTVTYDGGQTAGFNAWVCFIVTWNGSVATLWVNGIKQSTTRAVSPATTTTGKLRITSQATTDKYCSAAVWTRALSDAECTEFYNGGVNLRYADLS